MELEEDSIVLGIVEKIEHMNVFVKLQSGKIGTIVTSEIAPGRIKNLRAYVAPNKIIVCKVLRISNNHIDLSLRRVTSKEKKEILLKYQQEKDFEMGLKSILKENFSETEKKVKENFETLSDFLEKIQQDPDVLKKFIPKDFQEQILKLTEKKKKEIEVKKIVKLKCFDPRGLEKIKEILKIENNKAKVIYVSAGNYLIILKEEDYKTANHLMQNITEEIQKKSKKYSCEILIEEKK
jgi:translation initiation factor 2 alpha subunit (eIF-2alpha)